MCSLPTIVLKIILSTDICYFLFSQKYLISIDQNFPVSSFVLVLLLHCWPLFTEGGKNEHINAADLLLLVRQVLQLELIVPHFSLSCFFTADMLHSWSKLTSLRFACAILPHFSLRSWVSVRWTDCYWTIEPAFSCLLWLCCMHIGSFRGLFWCGNLPLFLKFLMHFLKKSLGFFIHVNSATSWLIKVLQPEKIHSLKFPRVQVMDLTQAVKHILVS